MQKTISPIDCSNQGLMIKLRIHPPLVKPHKPQRNNPPRKRIFFYHQPQSTQQAIIEILTSQSASEEIEQEQERIRATFQLPNWLK